MTAHDPAAVELDVPDTTAPSRGMQQLLSQYENALSCIRCGLCLSVCPTYQISFAEEESPRGRIALARAVAEGALPVTPDFVEHSQNCLLCEACTAVCPAGVQMEPLGVAVREVIGEQAGGPRWKRPLRRALLHATLGSMTRFRVLCRLAFLYQRSGARWLLRRSGLLTLLRLATADALLPDMPRRFVVPKGQRWTADGPNPPAPFPKGKGEHDGYLMCVEEPPTSPPAPFPKGKGEHARPSWLPSPLGEGSGERLGRRVALFTGCIMSTAFAQTTEATARTLARRGCEVVAVSGQGCCGALHLHSGETEGARALARRNLVAFNPDDFDDIVVNSAGCGSTLKGYGHLLAGDAALHARAIAFAAKVRDVTEALSSLPPPPSSSLPLTVTFQDPCHLAHAQRIAQQPRALLKSIPGVTLREMNESALCCGSAGIYNLTHPEKAATLLNRKLDNAAATGAEVIVTANPGCLLQLRAGAHDRRLPVQVRHIVDLLDEAERTTDLDGG